MNLLEYARNVVIVTVFGIRTTMSFMIITLMQNLIIPLATTIMITLAITTTGGTTSIKALGIFFMGMILASMIQSIPQYISNYLMIPPVRDLLTSLTGDVRVFVVSVAFQNLITGILPQAVVVSILTQSLDLVVYALLAYLLVVYPAAALIGTMVRTPMTASVVGLILYLILSMVTPVYLTTTLPIWRIVPLSILNPNFRDILQIMYTIFLSLTLYYVLLRRI
ncbi:MAG: hypothetical protein ACP5M7_00225 [Thermoproteota archaeon]|jgi:hypothetical protein